MRLFYRGASYEHEPVNVRTGKKGQVFKHHEPQPTFKLTYRGVTYFVDANTGSAEVPAPQTVDELNYREVSYSANKNAGAKMAALSQPTNPQVKIPDCFTRRDRAWACRRIHQANIWQNLQHRLQVARERGDQTLIKLLEAELRQIAPSTPKPMM